MNSILLALAFVICGAAADTVDPHVAVIFWKDGQIDKVNTITKKECEDITGYLKSKKWVMVGHENSELDYVQCKHENGFAPGWDKIRGFNDKER